MKTGIGLRTTLNTANKTLNQSQQGVATASHNISNAHKPGYSRQVLHIKTDPPLGTGSISIGQGAWVDRVVRSHDRLIENMVRSEGSHQSYLHSQLENLEHLEFFFNLENPSNLAKGYENFFNALRNCANQPNDRSARQYFVDMGEALAKQFRTNHQFLVQFKEELNRQIVSHLEEVNQILERLKNLNKEILAIADNVNEVGDLADERDRLVRDLGELIPIKYFEKEGGHLVILGPHDRVLIDGELLMSFETRQDPDDPQSVRVVMVDRASPATVLDCSDVLGHSENGKISSLLQVRDQDVVFFRDRLNEMARHLIRSVNEIHQQGFGLGSFANTNGRLFFETVPENLEAAQMISLNPFIRENLDAVGAAMTREAPGDNTILNILLELEHKPLIGDGTMSLLDAYTQLGTSIGMKTADYKKNLYQSEVVLAQLQAQREALSGVSLDEETIQLMKMQQLFGASAKVVQTADEMMQTVLSLKT